MTTAIRGLSAIVGAVLASGCLELGGSWEPTTTTATTTAATASSSTSPGTSGASSSGTSLPGTSSSSTSGATAGETETSGCTFLGCHDLPGTQVIKCDIWEQDCPEGEKCMPWASDGGSSWNATKCTPVDPNPDLPGEPCTVTGSAVSGVDSCVEGAMCWDVDFETKEGVCLALCSGSPEDPTCPRGSSCHIHGDGVLILCQPFCDPLLQDCPGDDLCLPLGPYWGCVLDASGDEGQYGDPCEYANACDPGLLCLNPEYVPDCNAGGGCSPFCDTDEANTCPGGGQVCVPFYDEGQAPKGFETIGFCGIPQ